MFKAFLLIFLLGAVLLSRKPTKRSRKTPTYPPYDMKCDCGRRADDEKARNECEKSVKLGGSGRVIGGCKAGHIPWFVYFRIHQQFNCGGVLINKFWVLSAAHCFWDELEFKRKQSKNGPKWSTAYNVSDFYRIEVYLGGSTPEKYESRPSYKTRFRALEIVIHPDYDQKTQNNDIALVRIDYPAVHDGIGLTFLKHNKFDPKSVMPICLPSSEKFPDEDRRVISVGRGFIKEDKERCFTDENGPEVFKPCAPKWVNPRFMEKDNRNEFKDVQEKCSKHDPPPSSENKICKNFHKKIQKLKKKYKNKEKLKKRDLFFLKHFITKNLSVSEPTETILVPTDYQLDDILKKNFIRCFKITPGKSGWCATCRTEAEEGQPGFCKPDEVHGGWEIRKNQTEFPVASTSSGWGFCHHRCTENPEKRFDDELQMVKLTTLSDEFCQDFLKDHPKIGSKLALNTKIELCAGFVSTINFTLFKYTAKKRKGFKFSKGNEAEKEMFRSKRVERVENSGNKAKRLAAKKGLIIGGRDTCGGDSGGPVWVENKNGRATLVGLVSRGRFCAYKNYPAIYTRVKKFLKWIFKETDKVETYRPVRKFTEKSPVQQINKGGYEKNPKSPKLRMWIEHCSDLTFHVHSFCKNQMSYVEERKKGALKKCERKTKKKRKRLRTRFCSRNEKKGTKRYKENCRKGKPRRNRKRKKNIG